MTGIFSDVSSRDRRIGRGTPQAMGAADGATSAAPEIRLSCRINVRPNDESCAMNAYCPLIPVGPAMRELPVQGSRQTGFRWLSAHPGLGQRLGGRLFFYRDAWAAIARGATLEEAERIGLTQAAALQAAYS